METKTQNFSAFRAGLGLKGLLGGLVIGSAVFAPVIFEPSHVDLWAQLLLLAATLVYVVFAIVKDRTKIALTVLQSLSAAVLIVISILLGAPIVVAIGLVAHAVWDLFHLVLAAVRTLVVRRSVHLRRCSGSGFFDFSLALVKDA